MNIIKNHCPNYESRRGCVPDMIVSHITAGTKASSAINSFMNPENDVSSNFVVDMDGAIYEMVSIEHAAWANGTTLNGDYRDYRKATNSIVKARAYNANLYTVSIEHVNLGGGALTPAQLAATIWLHKYIRDYVQAHYGRAIPADREHIVGHYEINPITRPSCPGKDFPWAALMAGISGTTTAKPFELDTEHVDVGVGKLYQVLVSADTLPVRVITGLDKANVSRPYADPKGRGYLIDIIGVEFGYGHVDVTCDGQVKTCNFNIVG